MDVPSRYLFSSGTGSFSCLRTGKERLGDCSSSGMSVFLLVKDTLPLPGAVNAVAVAFALTYLAISIYLAVKKRKERDAKC